MRLLDSIGASAGSRVPPSIRLDDLMAATRGRLLGTTRVTSFASAAVDSRHVTPGCCFVALRGEREDGHRYAAEAVRAGATVLLVAHPVDLPPESGAAIVEVANPLAALQEIAAWWRARMRARVVGITGSTGKTLAKEIMADVLGRTLRVLRSEGNLNSETGLPMTLLNLEPRDEVAVLEMGMYTEGEIARLVEIARPEVGVVLAVHATHLERAGSLAAIGRAKEELPAALPVDGLAVLNADDPRVAQMRHATRARVRTFGLDPSADVRATQIESHGLDGTSFVLHAPWEERRLTSATPGRHLVPHALAAVAVAEHLGVPFEEVVAALALGSRAPHRMARTETASGAIVIDDTYNASPESVGAALEFLAESEVAPGRHRYAVLGDMLELGPDEERLHRLIGARAAGVVDALVTVGERGRWIGEAATAAGLGRVSAARDADEALPIVERELAPGVGDLVLIKGSRGIELDRLVAALVGGGG